MENELKKASNDELYKAAEALVDAAICCREVSSNCEISRDPRLGSSGRHMSCGELSHAELVTVAERQGEFIS
jgi:hypothetical protein